MGGGRRSPQTPHTLGAVLAGGRSRRFGEDKAFATVGGISLVRRAAMALRPVTNRVVLVANDVERYADETLDTRPDLREGIGALGGVHTAVAWAAEEGATAAVVLACDMPFVPSSLVAALVEHVAPDRLVVPASAGPRGLEPLCAAYGVECLGPMERAIERGDRAVVSFFDYVRVHVLATEDVAAYGDPDTMFFNVNLPEDRSRAEALFAERRGSADPRHGPRLDRPGSRAYGEDDQ